MNWSIATSQHMPLVLAQQGGGPAYGNREAYEGGRKVGQITAFVVIAVIVGWVILKVFRRK